MAPATSSSTTSSRPVGRPPGTRRQFKAERRLKRELAGKEFQLEALRTAGSVVSELLRTAKSSPVTGLALGVLVIDILYRTRVISYTAAGAFYALFSVSAASDVIRSITAAFPFSSDAEQRNAAQPTNTATTEASSVAISPAKAGEKEA